MVEYICQLMDLWCHIIHNVHIISTINIVDSYVSHEVFFLHQYYVLLSSSFVFVSGNVHINAD